MKTRQLLAAVVALEVASGLPYGVVNELAPLWLRVRGVDLAALGALTLVGLPWTLKALWAPLVDRHGTLPRWIFGGLAGTAAGAGALAILAGRGGDLGGMLPLVVAVLVCVALASATQDLALDGWLVQVTPPEARGRVTGVRVASYRGAMALAGGGAAWIGATWGWPLAFGVAALVLATMAIPVAGLEAPPREAPSTPGSWGAALGEWLASRERVALLLFVVLYKLGDAAMAPMTRPFLLDSGLDAGTVGLLSSTAGAVLVSGGAILGGVLLERLGPMWGVLVLGSAQALSNLVYAAAAWRGDTAWAVAACVTESLTTGLGTAAMLSLVLAASAGAGSQAATRFAVLSAAGGLTRTLAGAVSGFGAARFGYATWFLLTFVMALPALGLVPWVTGARVRGGRGRS